MEALIQSLQEKVGLTAEQAKETANHVIEYFKAKVPAIFHEHLDAAAIGDSIKTKSEQLFAEAKDKSGDFLHAAQEKISGLMHSEPTEKV
jgi:predicted RNase H-related nuclease YkuK (DUF458 family)